MILDKLKAYAAAALAIAASILAAMFYREKAKLEQERRQAVSDRADVERQATDVALNGVKREQEAAHAPVDTRRRDEFERP